MTSTLKTHVPGAHQALLVNLTTLMELVPPPSSSKLKTLVSNDMFKNINCNIQTFLEFMFFLVYVWNHELCKEKLKFCWPIVEPKQKSLFLRTVCSILQDIQKNNPESQLPPINYALFMQPGGDKFCRIMLRFVEFLIMHNLKKDRIEVLQRPKGGSDDSLLSDATQIALDQGLEIQQHTVAIQEESKALTERGNVVANELKEAHKEEISRLAHFLASINVPSEERSKFMDPSDGQAIKSWTAQVKQKLKGMEERFKTLQVFASKCSECRTNAEIILTSSNFAVVDGNDLMPTITPELAKNLGMSEQDIHNTLMESGKLKLEGFLELGAKALDAFLSGLKRQDSSAVQGALPELRTKIVRYKERSKNLADVKQEMKETLENLKETDINLRRQIRDKESVDLAKSSSDASFPALSMLAQIPCTPPFPTLEQVSSEYEPCIISRPPIQGSLHEFDNILKLWRGEALPASLVKKNKEVRSSHKRSQCPSIPRPSLFSLNVTTMSNVAPPPFKEPKVAVESWYTPKHKHDLHQWLMTKHRSSQKTSKINLFSAASVIQEADSTVHSQEIESKFMTPQVETKPRLVPNTPVADEVTSIPTNLDSDEFSSEGDLPLEQASLEEIAEMFLSPCSPIPNPGLGGRSPISPLALPRVSPSPKMSLLASPLFLSPRPLPSSFIPQASATAVDSSMSSLQQRLQAIKMSHSKSDCLRRTWDDEDGIHPVRISVSSSIVRAPIKLELESPPHS